MKRLSKALLTAICLAVGTGAAWAADDYPSRPVKVIVPYAPGGATDIVARLVGDAFAKITGQQFVVINKPGAFGLLAIEEMAKSAPDGYTLMIGNVSTNAITPILYKQKLPFDYNTHVTAVTRLVDVPAFLLVTTANGFPVKNVKELVAYAKKHPGALRYGTVGLGSYPQYDMEYFDKRAGGLKMVALGNKNGAAGVIQDLIRGDAQTAFLNVASTAGMVKAGKMRAIALVNHARLKDYPHLPTMSELGFKGVGTIAWQGLFAPAGTPKPVLAKLYAAVTKALKSPELEAKFHKQHFNIVPSKSPAEAKVWLAGEIKHWQMITQEVKISMSK